MGRAADELTGGKLRAEVNSVFERSAMRYGFAPIVFGADRHGSYVWEASRQDDITRSITVSLAPQGEHVEAEAWATASSGGRFARREVRGLLFDEMKLHGYVNDNKDGLRRLIVDAVVVASDLRDEDLNDLYSLTALTERPDGPGR